MLKKIGQIEPGNMADKEIKKAYREFISSVKKIKGIELEGDRVDFYTIRIESKEQEVEE